MPAWPRQIFKLICHCLFQRFVHGFLRSQVGSLRTRAVLLLALSPAFVLAEIAVTSASLETTPSLTRVVIESDVEIRFSLVALKRTKGVTLELEGVALNPALLGLADKVAADHPYLSPIKVRASTSGVAATQLEFGIKAEAEPSVVAHKPQAGQGHRIVMEFAPSAATRRAAAPDDSSLMLLEVRLDNDVLADAITTYQFGRETFLPLGELARLLTLAIKTQPEQGTADGFVLSEARGFSLNVVQARITLAEQPQFFDPARVRWQSDDIYVAASLLSRWLPIDFEVNRSSLSLLVRPRERLPLQERLDRERLGARVGARGGYIDPGYPRQDVPYRLLDTPFIDQTFGVGLSSGNGSRQTSANYTAYLTGDLLGVESAFFVSSTKDNPTPEARFTLARHDPDAGLLGPLQARSVMFGSGVTTPSVANVGERSVIGDGYGLTVSNRPFTQPTSFDRHTLQGDLPPGWDVQLYFNDALVGFQFSRADGRYSFDDQPLVFGLNEFVLAFHGPLGQQRVERQSFLLEQSSTPPGAFYYILSLLRDKEGGLHSVAQFDWGLNKYFSATGGLVRSPTLVTASGGTPTLPGGIAKEQIYTNLGLRSFWESFIATTDFYRDPRGGLLNETGLKTGFGRLSMTYSRIWLNDYISAIYLPSTDPLRTRDKLRFDGAIPEWVLPALPLTLEVSRDKLESGTSSMALAGRIAAYLGGTSVSNQTTWQSSGGISTASGALQLNRRVGDMGLSTELAYSLRPDSKLSSVKLAADKRLGDAYQLNLGLVHSVGSSDTQFTSALNKSLGSFAMGANMSYSASAGYAVGLQFFIATSREPRQPEWRFSAQPKADTGAASVRLFVDSNGNGVMDDGEEPIQNASLTVNGNRTPVKTGANGVAWLEHLPIRQRVDIAVDTQTLEDPYWLPQRKGVSLVPRPGRVAELDFPIILTSEIDGTVYLVDKTTRRGIGDVVIELLDVNRRLVSTVKTGSDGYYIVPAVPLGRFYLRVSPEQVKQFGLIDPGVREIQIQPDGKFINGVDFSLSKRPAARVPNPSREESP
ncbi:MAG: carboxypeptidase regulatory-like domain-containing protein [Burkholderiales bacterium]|nr:carboxypeptidase regulatory-like domain-containing protein [Burkholderiales bacterium]